MVFKSTLIILVILILMEDGSSMRKTEKEEKEDRELAELVNKTLAEEKRKEDEEKKRKEVAKKEGDPEKKSSEGSGGSERRDEALPSSNITCPVAGSCPRSRTVLLQGSADLAPLVDPVQRRGSVLPARSALRRSRAMRSRVFPAGLVDLAHPIQ
jgi:hypothetical protein